MAATYNVGAAETYTTIQGAIDAIPDDLSGGGVQEVIVESGTYNETLLIDGFSNQSVSDYIKIRSKTGDEHGGIYGNGVLISDSGTGNTVDIRTSYTQFLDIEVNHNNDSGIAFTNSSSGSLRFERVLSRGQGGDGDSGNFNINGGNFINCVARIGNYGWNGTNVNVYNCITFDSFRGFQRSGGNFNIYNSVGNRFLPPGFGGDYNVSTNSEAPGANSLHNQSILSMKFVNAGIDYHIEQGSILQAAGSKQSSPFTKDVDEQSINPLQWPVGYDFLALPTCWKYTAPYKNSNRLWTANGPDDFPANLKVPKNVDISRGVMIDEGCLIDPSKFNIEQ